MTEELITEARAFAETLWANRDTAMANRFGRLVDALEAVTAERDEANHAAARQKLDAALFEAERDRLKAATEEALELIQPGRFMRPDEPGYAGTTRDVVSARGILSAALNWVRKSDGQETTIISHDPATTYNAWVVHKAKRTTGPMTRDDLIEKAAKAMLDESHGEGTWEMREPAEEALYLRRATVALAVFEESLAPTGDDREAIVDALLDELGWEWDEVPEEHIPSSRQILGDMADRVLAVVAGFRRSEVPEPSAENARPGFFPNGQCRHYQLADGWAKIWCIRTEDGHTEHETAGGVRWAWKAASKPQGEPSQVAIRAAVEADRQRIRSTIGAFVDEGVWAFDAAVSTLEKHDAALRAAAVRGTGGEQ